MAAQKSLEARVLQLETYAKVISILAVVLGLGGGYLGTLIRSANEKAQEAVTSAGNATDAVKQAAAEGVNDVRQAADAAVTVSVERIVPSAVAARIDTALSGLSAPPTDYGYGPHGGIAPCEKPGEVVVGVGVGDSQNARVRCAKLLIK